MRLRVQGQATPIYTAAMYGKAEVVAALVAAGANMNYPGKVRFWEVGKLGPICSPTMNVQYKMTG